jgi:hypothetical protein
MVLTVIFFREGNSEQSVQFGVDPVYHFAEVFLVFGEVIIIGLKNQSLPSL